MEKVKDKGPLVDDIYKKAQQINKKNKSIIAQRNVEDKGTAILVKDLDLWYGDFKALKKINMD